MKELINFLMDKYVLDFRSIITFGPLLLIYALLAGWLAGWLKTKKNVRTPYTRKVFHFLIFTSAAILQIAGGTKGLKLVILFGVIVACYVLWGVIRGYKSPFYTALARPTDAPKESMYIIVPLVTTALGGFFANVFFPQVAIIGYLVGGWGDAVGEPVGTKWGKHKYKVTSIAGVPATRSIEGSFAVALVGFIVAFIGLMFISVPVPFPKAIYIAFLCGIGGATVEAFSTHGIDNLTIQLAAAAIAYCLV
jgi:phytol kinase